MSEIGKIWLRHTPKLDCVVEKQKEAAPLFKIAEAIPRSLITLLKNPATP